VIDMLWSFWGLLLIAATAVTLFIACRRWWWWASDRAFERKLMRRMWFQNRMRRRQLRNYKWELKASTRTPPYLQE
jgi:hypothetical protein